MVVSKQFPRGQRKATELPTPKSDVNDEEKQLFGRVTSEHSGKQESFDVIDHLKDVTPQPDTKKFTRKSKKDGKEIPGFKTDEEAAVEAANKIKSPNFKTLQVNVPILGQILTINQYECVVCLPNQLKGYVNFKNDGFTPGLQVNDFILTTPSSLATGADGKTSTTVKLTLKPETVNKGVATGTETLQVGHAVLGKIKSVEDAGFEIDLGYDKIRSFWVTQDKSSYEIGDLLTFHVSSKKKRAVTVVPFSCANVETIASVQKNVSAGSIVTFTAHKGSKNRGKVLGQDSVVWNVNTDKLSNLKEVDSVQSASCIVSCLNKEEKHVHLYGNTTEAEVVPEIGDVSNGKVEKLVGEAPRTSVVIKTPTGSTIIVKPNQIPKDPKTGKQLFPKESKPIKFRIIKFCPFSNLAEATLIESLIECPFLTYAEAEKTHVGEIITGEIKEVKAGVGIELKLGGNNLIGFMPMDLISDVTLESGLKKFKAGKKLRARILNVDPSKCRVTLTAKKSLLDSKLVRILSVEQILNNEGRSSVQTHAVVTGVMQDAISVAFYNNLFGFIPKRFLQDIGVVDPTTFYRVGQTLKVAIQHATKNSRDEDELVCAPVASKKPEVPRFKPGQVYKGKIVEKKKTGFLLSIKHDEKTFKYLLDKNHFSDFDTISEIIYENHKIGGVLDNLVAVDIGTLTWKESLRQVADLNEGKEINLEVGRSYLGYVSGLNPLNVQIGFKRAFCPKSYVADEYVDKPEEFYKLGQTVLACVKDFEKVDREDMDTEDEETDDKKDSDKKEASKLKFIVSLKKSDTDANLESIELTDLSNYGDANQKVGKYLADNAHLLKSYLNCLNAVVEDYPEKTQKLLLPGYKKKEKMLNFNGVLHYAEQNKEILCENSDVVIAGTKVKKDGKDQTNYFIISRRSHVNSPIGVSGQYSLMINSDNLKFEALDETMSDIFKHSTKNLKLAVLTTKMSISGTQIPDSGVMVNCKGIVSQVNSSHMVVKSELKSDNLEAKIHVLDSLAEKCLKDEYSVGQKVDFVYWREQKEVERLKVRGSMRSRKPFKLQMSKKFDRSVLKTKNEDEKSGDKSEEPKPEIGYKGVIINVDLNKKQVELELELPAQKIITKSFLPLISIEEILANKMVESPGDYEGMVLENIKIAKFQSTTSLEVTLVDNASVDIKEGEIINAIFDKVHNHDPFVCNLTLAGGLRGTISASLYKAEPKFPLGSIVPLKILSVVDNKIELSHPDLGNLIPVNATIRGKTVKSWVQSISKAGIFVRMIDYDHVGRIAFSDFTDAHVEDFGKALELMPIGTELFLKVKSFSKLDNKVSLMRHKDQKDLLEGFSKRNDGISKKIELRKKIEETKKKRQDRKREIARKENKDTDEAPEKLAKKVDGLKVDSKKESSMSLDINSSMADALKKRKQEQENSESDDSESETESDPKADSKSDKKSVSNPEPVATREKEQNLLDSKSNLPTNLEEWERTIQANNKSSMLWIAYAKFHLETSELEKAKLVLNRSLESIPYEDESERMNIFSTQLSLEARFGSDESFNKVFGELKKRADEEGLYKKAIQIVQSVPHKEDLVKDLFKKSVKKFSDVSAFWKGWVEYECLVRKDFDTARSIVEKSVKVIENKKSQVEVLLSLARCELKSADAYEHGRTIVEQVLKSQPKDIVTWKAYISATENKGDISNARQLYERVTQVKLSKKSLANMFRSWMSFEEKFGDDDSQELVRSRVAQKDRGLNDDDMEIED